MPRIRSIKPELVRLRQLGQVSPGATATFTLLMPHADDEGRYEYQPALVKADVWPLNVVVGEGTIQRWVDELLGVGLLCQYRVDGACYLHYPAWSDIQKPPHPTPSRIPPCPREPHGMVPDHSRGLTSPHEDSGGLKPRARAQEVDLEVEVEGKGKDLELLPPDVGSSAPENGAPVQPVRSARAAEAALGVVERLKASVDSGRRSWSFSAAVKAEWDQLLDDDGNLSAARDFLVWFKTEMQDGKASTLDWQMAMQKVKRWRARALYGVEQAVTRVDSDGMDFWKYVEAVCAQAQARSEGGA